jgi:hypothetical protein
MRRVRSRWCKKRKRSDLRMRQLQLNLPRQSLQIMRLTFLKTVGIIALSLCAVGFARGSGVQDATQFALGGIGVAGTISQGEAALRTILDEPDAVARMEKILPSATDAGRLYIFVGLRMRDRSAYKRAFDSYSKHDSTVETVRGCTISKESFQAVMHEIDRGNFDVLLKQRPR